VAHVKTFFYLQRWPSWIDKKKTKTFSANQIASIIETNGHAELEEYDIHGRGLSK